MKVDNELVYELAQLAKLEFDNKTKMEEYLYEIGDGYLYAKFYAKGSLYDEICEHDE